MSSAISDTSAYKLCMSECYNRRRWLLLHGLDWQDVGHDAYLRWLRKGMISAKLAAKDECWDAVADTMHDSVMRDRANKPPHWRVAGRSRPVPLHESGDDMPYESSLDTSLQVDELRQFAGGSFAETIDAYLQCHGIQKAAAKLLGIAEVTINKRFAALRRAVAA